MVNEAHTPGRWTVGKGQYALMALVMMVAGTVGVIAGRSWGQASNGTSQLPSVNQITLPKGGLLFKTSEGKLAAKLDADEGGGFLVIYNTSEKVAVTIGASTYGGGGLIGLSSGKGAGDVLQLAGHDQGGSISLLSQKRGKRVVELSADDDGGIVSVNGPTGDEAVTIGTNELGSMINGTIEVRESRSGKLLWSAPPTARQK